MIHKYPVILKSMRFVMIDRSFTLCELNGRDALAAHKAFEQFGGESIRTRLILRSITHIDDEPVYYPLLEWLSLTVGKRIMIDAAYSTMNDVSPAEAERFIMVNSL